MIAVLARFELKDEERLGRGDGCRGSGLELETLIYVVHKVEDSPLSRVFYELYASPDARRHHESTEHMTHAFDELGQYVVSVQVENLGEPVGRLR